MRYRENVVAFRTLNLRQQYTFYTYPVYAGILLCYLDALFTQLLGNTLRITLILIYIFSQWAEAGDWVENYWN